MVSEVVQSKDLFSKKINSWLSNKSTIGERKFTDKCYSGSSEYLSESHQFGNIDKDMKLI